jgi:hypothetical protein
MRYYFHQAHHCDASRIHHGANASALHALASAPEKLEGGIAPAESLHQAGRIEVARDFAGGD